MTVSRPEQLVGILARQVELLAGLVTASQQLRAAVVAGNVGAVGDVVSRYEELLAQVADQDRTLQQLTGTGEEHVAAQELTDLHGRLADRVRELRDLQDENRILLRHAHGRATFRLQLMTGSARPVRLVDRRA